MAAVTEQDLAMNGGEPVRAEPFPPWPYFWQEEKDAVTAVLDSNDVNYHRGSKGIEFEQAFADYYGVKHGIAVCNGGAALHCAMYAIGVGPGDEVIVPPYTYIASCLAPLYVNAVPIFVDIDADMLNISPDEIRKSITDRTRAIVPVHMCGRPCEMDEIMQIADEHELMVVEDCAQAHGAEYKGRKVGSFGQIAAFSFCQTKHITTGGEGGMIVTDDDELAARARAAKDYGNRMDLRSGQGRWGGSGRVGIGWNLRMTEMQSAMGLVLLGKLDDFVAKRRALAAYLTEGLKDIPSLDPVPEGPGRNHTYFGYDCLFNPGAATCTRDKFVAAVRAEGVLARTGAVPDNHLDPVFSDRLGYGGTEFPFVSPYNERAGTYGPGLCPVAEELGQRLVVLEVHPTIEEKDCDDVLAAVAKVTGAYQA